MFEAVEGMLSEGRAFSKIAPNVVVKVAMSETGLEAISRFAEEGIPDVRALLEPPLDVRDVEVRVGAGALELAAAVRRKPVADRKARDGDRHAVQRPPLQPGDRLAHVDASRAARETVICPLSRGSRSTSSERRSNSGSSSRNNTP